MSTFTNILQQKINNLQAQIRQLQEQNAHLRNKARWLMEAAAASSDMSMLPQPEVQDMQTPSGQYGGNPDRYTMGREIVPGIPFPSGWGHWGGNRFRKEVQPDGSINYYSPSGKHVGVYFPGPPPSFWVITTDTYYRWNAEKQKWEKS